MTQGYLQISGIARIWCSIDPCAQVVLAMGAMMNRTVKRHWHPNGAGE